MNNQLGGLSNTAWIVVIVLVIVGFFLALSDDVSNFWNIVGGVILAGAVIGWGVGFFTKKD